MNRHLLAGMDSFHPPFPLKKHVVIIAVVTLISGTAAVQFAPEAPRAQLEAARKAMSIARHLQAGIYAPEEMSAAQESWQRTWKSWEDNNDKWFLRRDFSEVGRLALLTFKQADLAAARAAAARDSLALISIATMLAVKDKIIDLQSTYDEIALPRAYAGTLRQSALLAAECEAAFSREDFVRAADRANAALESVSRISDHNVKLLDGYFANLRKWRQWAKEAIAWSDSTGRELIIVDKLAHLCQVYVDGQLQAEYEIELGPRWMGQKYLQGDHATPEGRYFVTQKKAGDETRYYKALEINYPNAEDSVRFSMAQESGSIPATAHPGGLIEIHGDGGKGSDWTAGCVALQNQDMDEIYSLVGVGTPVTIVGSLSGPSKRKLDKLALLREAR